MPDLHDVRRACLSLPGVIERPSWGQPAWFAATLMARMWDEGILTLKSRERQALVAMNPETYFWTPHHDKSALLVLVRLDLVGTAELLELIDESYRIAGPLPGGTGQR